MFFGTFPRQLGIKDESFGALMTAFNDEYEEASDKERNLRVNKLKAIINYFCVIYYRKEKIPITAYADLIIFQRQKCPIKES